MYKIASDDYVWNLKGIQHSHINILKQQPNLIQNKSLVQSKYLIANLPFDNLKEMYWLLIRPYLHLIGYFQMSYPMYQGGLTRIKLDIHDATITGEQIAVTEEPLVESSRFSLFPDVSIRNLNALEIHKKPLFKIRFTRNASGELDVSCDCRVSETRHPIHISGVGQSEHSFGTSILLLLNDRWTK
jgi:hypothetical protein